MSDLFDYLLVKYQEAPATEGGIQALSLDQAPEYFEHFTAFCRRYLSGDPIRALSPVSEGISLQLQSGAIVRLGQPEPAYPTASAVPISRSSGSTTVSVPVVPIAGKAP